MQNMDSFVIVTVLTRVIYREPDEEVNLLSDNGRRIFTLVNFVAICGVFSVFGICANIINIVIFVKQGIHNSINIGLLGLAIADFCCLFTLAVISAFVNPYFEDADTFLEPKEVLYLIGGWPHICFTRVSCWITVYITAERCMCIVLPLTVKQLITPKRTATAVGLIYIIMILSLFPEYVKSYIGWKFYPLSNKTRLGLLFTEHKDAVEGLVFILNAVLGMTSFPAIIIFASLLIFNLNVKRKWRQRAAAVKEGRGPTSNRDIKTMRMIAFIAGVLILCYTPDLIITLLIFSEPEFNLLGRYFNLGLALWSVGIVFHAINSSINILIYYRMSSNYKRTFQELMACCYRISNRATIVFS